MHLAGPRDHPEGLSTTFVLLASGRRSGARGEISIDGRGLADPRSFDRGVRRPLRRRPVHGDGARQPLPLHRGARLRPAADGRVLADPARLLRLRGDPHRAAGARLSHAGDEQQHRAVHRHDDRVGPQHDQRVRPRAPRAGRRDRRQRSLPDRDSRQRHAVLPTGLRRRAALRLRQPQGAPTRHGRLVPGGFSLTSTTSTRPGWCCRRARFTAAASRCARPGA